MWGKKEKIYQHFNIFNYTYLPKTDICLFFSSSFFYEPFPYALFIYADVKELTKKSG